MSILIPLVFLQGSVMFFEKDQEPGAGNQDIPSSRNRN
jgi:hypothetical protein